MRIAATGVLEAPPNTALIYRGPYEEIIPQMARDGFEAAELHILDSAQTDRKKLWDILHEHDMALSSIGTGSVYSARHYNLADRDRSVREKTILHLREHMITAQPDHAVVILGVVAGRFIDAGSPEAYRENLTESLYKLDEMAQELDVPLGLEIMGRHDSDWLNNMRIGAAFLRGNAFKKILMNIDTFYMNIEEAEMGASIRAAGDLIGHVHIADNNRWYPGYGHIDFRNVLQALSDIGYDGTLALETYMYPDSSTSGKRGLAYLTFLMETIKESTWR